MLIYDTEKLDQIPINDVVEALGGSYKNDKLPSVQQYNMRCCNSAQHKDNDKKPSLTIWKEINACKCHVCGIKGHPIALVQMAKNKDFKEACEWLHDTFKVPYKEEGGIPRKQAEKFLKAEPKEIKYMSFDKGKKYTIIPINKFIGRYTQLSKQQRLKIVYTYIYKESLKTDRKTLMSYYTSRGIENNIHLDKIGFLDKEDITNVISQLTERFPLEDLIEFGILNNATHKFPFQWRQPKKVILVPSFDLYSNMVEGFMLRPVDDTNHWFKGKESRLSVPSILKPLPFGLGYKILRSDCDIYITEGHIDALSLPSELCFIGVPGINSFEKEQLGLLKGRNIKLCFDQDEPGQMAAWGHTTITFLSKTFVIPNSQKEDIEGMIRVFKTMQIDFDIRTEEGFRDVLLKAGAKSVEIMTWDPKLGKDLNDLVHNKRDLHSILKLQKK